MMTENQKPIHVIGGGLAGCEAAWQIARQGLPVVLYEMRPTRKTDAHTGEGLAELVCSNSLRSDETMKSAVGLLHEEMRRCDSVIIAAADKAKVPAGAALAVDRDDFSNNVEAALASNPLITVKREEVSKLPDPEEGLVIVASGPLTSDALAGAIAEVTDNDSLAFFDAIAPIVHKDSIDFDKAWFQSRWDKGDGKDYINCPMSREQYDAFLHELLNAEYGEFKEWEKDTPYFDGCLPIEVMAERGPQTLTYGPLKPIGLTNPHDPTNKPYAIVQLRQDNKLGTLWNMVGFQTKMKYGEQTRVLRMIPGLEKAEFARLGGLHRNTFINSPRLLDAKMRLKKHPHIRFAGQITGVEGYVESAACGLMAGRLAAADALGVELQTPPPTTALGALVAHITVGAEADTFQPMNVNFGLIEPFDKKVPKKQRKEAYATRALEVLAEWLTTCGEVLPKP